MGRYRGFGASDEVNGALIGGGVTWAVSLGVRFFASGKPAAKWSGLIGAAAGVAASYTLGRYSPKFSGAWKSGAITAALIGVPRQLEEMLVAQGVLKGDEGYLGVVTSEQINGYGGYGLGNPVQLLDSGGGSTGMLGVTVPEEFQGAYGDEMQGGMGAGGPVELLGGFGSNWMSS